MSRSTGEKVHVLGATKMCKRYNQDLHKSEIHLNAGTLVKKNQGLGPVRWFSKRST